MTYNLAKIMGRAWEIRRDPRNVYTFQTCLRLAWAEAKGCKRYGFNLESARASITAYIMKLMRNLVDEHDVHKLEILRAALLAPIDRQGVAVMDGKTVGLCKYAVRNA